MFSINIYLRFALMTVLIGGGIILAFVLGFWYAFPFIFIGLLFFLGYMLLGTVQSSAKMMQNMNFIGSEKRLQLTMSPKLLYKPNRAYYYMIQGTLASQLHNDHQAAEQLFLKAQETGLPSDNEQAMINLQLANLAANKGKWNQAKNYFRIAKKMKVTEPELKEQMKQFEKAITNRGQLKHMQGMKQAGKRMRRF